MSRGLGDVYKRQRWHSVKEGIIYPDEFIPVLEKSGYIVDVDAYVWEKVFAAIHIWKTGGITPVPISVNVSRSHVYQKSFAGVLEKKEYYTGNKTARLFHLHIFRPEYGRADFAKPADKCNEVFGREHKNNTYAEIGWRYPVYDGKSSE